MFIKPGLAVVCAGMACWASVVTAQVGLPSADAASASVSTTGTDVSITPTQRARLVEKLALVNQVLSVVGQQGGVSNDQKRWLAESLYGMSLEQIQAMGIPGSYPATVNAMSSVKTTMKALGSASTDLVYRPITPCRYIDTRNVGGTISGFRDFDLHNTGAAYGGSGACDPKSAAPGGDPANIGAVAFNLAIIGVSPSNAPGFMGARPQGSSNSTALVNWYESGPSVQASNASAVSINQTNGQIEFFGTPTDIVVDMLGIFTPPAPTALDCVQVTLVSPSIPSNGRTFAQPTCAAGYTVTGGGVTAATNDNNRIEASEAVGNGWFTAVLNASAGTRVYTFSANCCRVPGR
jgi:hypothetical protein